MHGYNCMCVCVRAQLEDMAEGWWSKDPLQVATLPFDG